MSNLTYRVKVKIEVDVDFPGDDVAGTTQRVLNEAARQTVIDLLPTKIANRCIVTAGRTVAGGLMDVERYDGGPALIRVPVPQPGDPILDDIEAEA